MVYKQPFNPKKPVICMDETTKQLVKETRKRIPVEPGVPERYDHEYERNGTCNLFMFYNPFGGHRYVSVTEHRTRKDWALEIKNLLDNYYPKAQKVILVMDNLNTHSGASLYETFPPDEARRLLERLEIHFTPKHGSWLNIAEIELRVLGVQCLNRRISDIFTLKQEIEHWQNQRNFKESKVDWQFSADNARIKLKRLYPTLSD